MGAAFNTMELEGGKTREEVKRLFAAAQDRDLYENGHSYSGGFGMAVGLVFTPKSFESYGDAETWLCDNCHKWEAAQAVTYKDPAGETKWLIGAWCSS